MFKELNKKSLSVKEPIWKDIVADGTYEDYKTITDKQGFCKVKSMPIKFWKASGKGFFVEKEDNALAIRDDLKVTNYWQKR